MNSNESFYSSPLIIHLRVKSLRMCLDNILERERKGRGGAIDVFPNER